MSDYTSVEWIDRARFVPITLLAYWQLKYTDRPFTVWANVNVGIPPGECAARYRDMQVLKAMCYHTAPVGGFERYIITFFDPYTEEIVVQDWDHGTFWVDPDPAQSEDL